MIEQLTDVFNSSWPTLLIFVIIIVIIRLAYLKSNSKKFVFHKEILSLLFIVYILLLFSLVTYTESKCNNFNYIPLTEIFRYKVGSNLFYQQVLGNIILFIPFGYFVTYYVKLKKIGSIFFITLLSSATIEVVQYFIGRCADIDDIILNVVGGILGFLLFIGLDAIRKHLPKLFQKDFIYSILSLLLIVFIILYVLGVVNLG